MTKRKNLIKKILKGVGIAIAAPIALFLLLAILIYIPPVQNWAVDKVASSLSDSTGLAFSVDKVRLKFPLDLTVNGVRATQRGDSVLDARTLQLDLALLPLFQGRADVQGVSLRDAWVNSRDLISNTQLIGRVGRFEAAAHGIDWKHQTVQVDHATLSDADMTVLLCDTARKDTTSKPSQWLIRVKRADIARTAVRLSLPGDSLRIGAYLGTARLTQGVFDTGKQHHTVQKILLNESSLQYDLPHEKALAKGLDLHHIHVRRLGLSADTLSYNREGVLRVGIRRLTFEETRSGFSVNNLAGAVYYDSTQVRLPALALRTPHSTLNADIALLFAALQRGTTRGITLGIDGRIGWQDVLALGRPFLPTEVSAAYPRRPLRIRGDVSGSLSHLTLRNLTLQLPGVARLSGTAVLHDITEPYRSGKARLDLRGEDLGFINRLLPKDVRQTVFIPNGLTAAGTVGFNGDRYEADLNIAQGGGRLQAKGAVDTRRETYTVAGRATRFPLGTFLPTTELERFSGTLAATGHGFDVLSPASRLQAKTDIEAFRLGNYDLDGLHLDIQSSGGRMQGTFRADNRLVKGEGSFSATLDKVIRLDLQAQLPMLNVGALALNGDTLTAGGTVNLTAYTDRSFNTFGATGTLLNPYYITPTMGMATENVTFDFASAADTTCCNLRSGDMALRFGLKGDVNRIAKQFGEFSDLLGKQLAKRHLDQHALTQKLPVFNLFLDSGTNNPLAKILRNNDITWQTAYINLNCNPRDGLNGTAHIGSLTGGSLLLDTIDARVAQDTSGVQMTAFVHNYKKKNPDKFQATAKAYLLSEGAGLHAEFKDKDGIEGVRLGVKGDFEKEGIRLKLYPENPILAYRKFTINDDNYIYLGRKKQIGANVKLMAEDGTGIQLYGEPNDSVNDLTAGFINVNLAELSAAIPYMPKLEGMLTGDVHFMDDHKSVSAMADLTAKNFAYEGTALGNIGVEGIYLPKTGGEHHASMFISKDEQEVLAFNGSYFDRNGGEIAGEGELHDFPLPFVNGFLSGTDVMMRGIAGGDFRLSGSTSRPVINGQLQLDSAHVYSDVYGFDFRLNDAPVAIENSRLTFTDYHLYSTGQQPLVINGTLDASRLERIALDFKMKARNFELVNTQKKKESTLFGKVFTNFDGTLRGNTADGMFLRGLLAVLDNTDMTYLLKDSPLTVEDRLKGLVTFVNFADSSTTEEPVAESVGVDLSLGISISDQTKFLCELSEDGSSYVDVKGGGNLSLRMTQQGDMRLTGRLTVSEGKMKYELPVIPLKTFTIAEGSYVEFTGDPANPTLNITASERVKANVTENDQLRSVTFNVGLAITKPLNDMGLQFTIEAPEDLTVQNELNSMSLEQRGKAAVAMLATGMYINDEGQSSGSGLKANNALNAFLQNEIQNIAGSALKTIDVSVGVESGTSKTGTTTTDYAFQFSKRFLDDRVNVIIGGRVSAGVDADNSAESIIDNITVEYRLDKGSTRYVKVFYDRDSRDPLEGQLTKAGAGLVLKRKSDRLGELFIFRKKKNEED